MEQLLHYVWKHKIFPLRVLYTTEGKEVEVINPGIHNSNAGPDFQNAKVKIGGTLWVGHVEIHVRSSDWFRHGHDKDAAYANTILHVASDIDCDIPYPDGTPMPQLQLEPPEYVRANYDELARSEHRPRCRDVVRGMSRFMVHTWMSALQVERLEQRTRQIMSRRDMLNKDWEATFFVTLARNFGFGINGDAFEQWAKAVPLTATGKHRDDLFQIEAIFFGQAGLLNGNSLYGKHPVSGTDDDYFARLCTEYRYMRQKFSLTPVSSSIWRFMRLRPQNFPYMRIAQLAALYHERRISLSRLLNAESRVEIYDLMQAKVSKYWRTHYTFASTASADTEKGLSESSLNLVVINTAVPLLFAYGRYKNEERLCERAIRILEEIKAENNYITRLWRDAGVKCESAADSQALVQLTHGYCEPHDCLRCRFGYEFVRQNPGLLREKEE
ncbi:MAG: DUF2851 family protein [Bacteroides sp.]|nr:DUF2851 family protein [Roseburia sp.]MCM1347486.1 DUF2851 family protein [Bacteroides sp.]MCM1421958.1 DUF2851 family protein [Bacteroides sp.]